MHIGIREHWGEPRPFGLSQSDRRQHLYLIGKSGSGKTTLVRNLIIQDIEAGRGVGLIDPHGDLAQELLDHIPSHRLDDVVYFDPADDDFPVAFNLFDSNQSPHIVASGIVGAMKSIWVDSWGPRLEYILYATVAALLECEGVSLLGVQRMLSDAKYRDWVVKQVKDPIVRSFWVNEFENYNRSFMQEAIAPILNKVGQLLMSPQVRNVLGQVRSKIDARFIMDHSRIFIANLSKGRLGEDKSNLMGALLVAQFQLAAMSRTDIPEQERKDFNLVVDEFQSFTSESFVSILSEARKYRLCLTLSHQYIEQIAPSVRQAIFGNVGSIVAFRVGFADAKLLAGEFGDGYNPHNFTELGNYEVTVKMLADGHQTPPFSGKTLPPLGTRYGRSEKLILRTRERFGTPREKVESKIHKWLER